MNQNKKDHFLKISKFLKQHKNLHSLEMLRYYPGNFPDEIEDWIDELQDWSFDQFADFESFPHEDKVNSASFKVYVQSIRELAKVKIETIEESQLPKSLLRNVNRKKEHEISILKTISNSLNISSIIDVGGGVGLLSSSLVAGTKRHAYCLDRDSVLQKKGARRLERWRKEDLNKLTFVLKDFSSDSTLDQNIDKDNNLVISLHGCGNLSSSVVKFAVNSRHAYVMNLGCCYHKIENDYNLSQASKDHSIKFTQNALHLASRSAAIVNADDIKTRFQFKRFRYTFHYYFYDHYKRPFLSIGNASKKDYNGEFCEYLLKYGPDEFKEKINSRDVQSYFESDSIITKVKRNYAADTIRFLLGRLIELYIVLDRALYLEEHGYDTQVSEIFQRDLSPRNLMIRSCRSSS